MTRLILVQARSLTRARVHELLRTGRHGKQLLRLDGPVLALRRALGGFSLGRLRAAVTAGVRHVSVRRLECLEVVVGRKLSVLDVHDAVAVGLDGVLICETARIHARHLGGEERCNLAPLAVGLDAAVLGEENGAREVLVGFDFLVPACAFEGLEAVLLVAPGVVVEGEEVGAGVVGTAVEVEGLLLNDFGDISGGVADGDLAGVAVGDVLLHVAGDGFDVGGCVSVVDGVDDFVAGEEDEKVVVVCELVDGGEDGLKVDIVVGTVESSVRLAVEREFRRVGIEGKVDTCFVENGHSFVMVLRVVDRVDADGVDAEILEVLHVAAQAL